LTPLTGESQKNFLGLRISLQEDLTHSSKKHRTGVFGQESLLQSACTNKTAEADCSTQDIHPRPPMQFDHKDKARSHLKVEDCDVEEDACGANFRRSFYQTIEENAQLKSCRH